MTRASIHDTIDRPWTALPPVRVGPVPAHAPTPHAYVTVDRDGEPFLRIDVYLGDEFSCFEQAVVWRDLVVIGLGGSVHVVPLSGGPPRTIPLGGYFGHLYPHDEFLLVASADRLRCFDRTGRVVWTSEDLGIDGVVVTRIDGDTIHGEGEWDPPGGWRPFAIDVRTGLLKRVE
jgi:hypothetical protein